MPFSSDTARMRRVYADLHIHIGSAQGKRVKITASTKLTLRSIIDDFAIIKGLAIVGIVDCGSDPVFSELCEMLINNEVYEHPNGGIITSKGLCVLLGSEIESKEGVHLIIYVPTINALEKMRKFLKGRVKNTVLSTQSTNATITELINLSYLIDGIICPAHVFTPYKGIYGSWSDKLSVSLGRTFAYIKAIELGLSADTEMADHISELRNLTFISNSDAHSGPNIGREYNALRLKELSFKEVKMALENTDGRRVINNYGIDPRLGKYYNNYCPSCHSNFEKSLSDSVCPACNTSGVVKGVCQRIAAIADREQAHHPINRAQYLYRIPLLSLPGFGIKTVAKLRKKFSNEIEIMENVAAEELRKVIGEEKSNAIMRIRSGDFDIKPGGGGLYGKVVFNN